MWRIAHSIDVVIWVNKVDWIHFRFMSYKCDFWGTWDWRVNVIVGFFRSWSMFVIVLKYLLYCFLFLNKQCTSESICLQFYIMLHQYFSHLLVVKSTSNTFFFRVWRWEFLWYLEESVFILSTCVFMYMLALIGDVLVIKGISKVSVNNIFNRVWRTCCFCFRICCF